MIQRIQTVYLLLVAILSAIFAIIMSKEIIYSLLSAIPGLLALIAIFLYKNRKRQILIVRILLFFLGILSGYIIVALLQRDKSGLAAVNALPLIALVFAILAQKAIQKDEKLVRSLDRLR